MRGPATGLSCCDGWLELRTAIAACEVKDLSVRFGRA